LEGYRERFKKKEGFDWTLTHSILEAIPAGNWTSYNSLAKAVGTVAQALGNHLASCGQCPNPHKVLTWDGRVSENFEWLDPHDNRTPSEILQSEGVRIHDQIADREQQLGLDDLLALAGDID
jgi:alkylated DNA nucleotide flippase Atl1